MESDRSLLLTSSKAFINVFTEVLLNWAPLLSLHFTSIFEARSTELRLSVLSWSNTWEDRPSDNPSLQHSCPICWAISGRYLSVSIPLYTPVSISMHQQQQKFKSITIQLVFSWAAVAQAVEVSGRLIQESFGLLISVKKMRYTDVGNASLAPEPRKQPHWL